MKKLDTLVEDSGSSDSEDMVEEETIPEPKGLMARRTM